MMYLIKRSFGDLGLGETEESQMQSLPGIDRVQDQFRPLS